MVMGFAQLPSISYQLVFLYSLTTLVSSQNWLIGSVIPPDYDKTQPPLLNGHVLVDASMVLNRFSAASDQRSLNVDVMFCLKWYDYRLLNINPTTINQSNHFETVTYTSVRSTNFSQFWLPKVYFRNALSSSVVESLQDVQYIEVWPDTKMVGWCNRVRAEFVCVFDLAQFPFDAQECLIELQSAGNTIQHLDITLSSVKTRTIGTDQLRLHHAWNGSCRLDNPDHLTGIQATDTCVYMGVRLVRHISYYVIRYFCPTFLCLVVSFCSFFVATNGWPARVILTLVVYLTVKTVSQTAYDEVPVPGVVPLFWWLWVIQFFLYMNLIEYATALAWVQYAEDKKRAHAANRSSPDGHYFGKKTWFHAGGILLDKILHRFYGPIDFYRDPPGRNKVDYTARVLYPAIMFVFVLIFIIANVSRWAVFYV